MENKCTCLPSLCQKNYQIRWKFDVAITKIINCSKKVSKNLFHCRDFLLVFIVIIVIFKTSSTYHL